MTKIVTLQVTVRVDSGVPDAEVAQQIGDQLDLDGWDWDVGYPDVVSSVPVPEPGILLTAGQIRAWAGLGRDLTPDELEDLDEAIPNSSIPDAIETICAEALGLTAVVPPGRPIAEEKPPPGAGSVTLAETGYTLADVVTVTTGKLGGPEGSVTGVVTARLAAAGITVVRMYSAGRLWNDYPVQTADIKETRRNRSS